VRYDEQNVESEDDQEKYMSAAQDTPAEDDWFHDIVGEKNERDGQHQTQPLEDEQNHENRDDEIPSRQGVDSYSLQRLNVHTDTPRASTKEASPFSAGNFPAASNPTGASPAAITEGSPREASPAGAKAGVKKVVMVRKVLQKVASNREPEVECLMVYYSTLSFL
jgi:hypothetical protein